MKQNDRSGEWREYVIAARRKVLIASYHESVIVENGLAQYLSEEAPVELQAHFEGLLYSFVGATDQLAEGINRGFGLNLRWPKPWDSVGAMPACSLRDELESWNGAALVGDVRALRVLSTHHHYDKIIDRDRWVAEKPPRSRYSGLRCLDEYSSSVARHLEGLVPLIDELEKEVDEGISLQRRGTSSGNP